MCAIPTPKNKFTPSEPINRCSQKHIAAQVFRKQIQLHPVLHTIMPALSTLYSTALPLVGCAPQPHCCEMPPEATSALMAPCPPHAVPARTSQPAEQPLGKDGETGEELGPKPAALPNWEQGGHRPLFHTHKGS